MSVDVDTIVIGAGVVGLATARALALAGRETWVLESYERVGEGVSSRNSGVIHAGLYYPPGSLKARHCVRGYHLLYEYCAKRGVPHRRCGKLVVAVTEAERAALEALLERAKINGTGGLRWLEAADAKKLEPALECVAAIDSPDSGVVDPAELCMALAGEIEQHNGRVVLNTEVARVQRSNDGFRVETATGDAVTCARLVNAAGLRATHVARAIEGLAADHVPKQYYGQGHYYGVQRKTPFQRLIYPMPEKHGLGVHLGFDFAGRVRFGPDVRFVPEPDYRFDDSQRAAFAASIRRWWPVVRDEELTPDFVGVRPKIYGPGETQADFRIDDASRHGIANLVNLFGIESPGLTSSLAIGEDVAQRLVGAAVRIRS